MTPIDNHIVDTEIVPGLPRPWCKRRSTGGFEVRTKEESHGGGCEDKGRGVDVPPLLCVYCE